MLNLVLFGGFAVFRELGRVARWAVPKPIRRAVWSYVRNTQRQRRVQESKSIPYYELQWENIQHARLLLDREDLLSLLPKGGVVAEAGVDEGIFSERILAICEPSKLHLIDVWDSERYHSGKAKAVENKFREQIRAGQIVVNRGYSTEVLRGFSDEYFDWIYIDTAHTYETTVRELAVASQKVKASGIISGHDYVTGNWNKGLRYGVIEAVHEFCVREHWEILYLTTETHQHRSFAIRAIDVHPQAHTESHQSCL